MKESLKKGGYKICHIQEKMDINDSEIKSLEELASEDCHILFDTCVISRPLGNSTKFLEGKIIKEKADFYEKNNNFLDELIRYIVNKGNFFVTSYIIKEIVNHNSYHYKKAIRKEGGCRDRELLRLRRLFKREEQNKRRVANAFIDNDKLIILEGEMKKLYEKVSEKYQGLIEEYGLSNVDFDFLITGITLAMTSNPVIFLSNDYKIFHARNRILKREKIDEKMIRFFVREDFFSFRSLFYHKCHKFEQLLGGS